MRKDLCFKRFLWTILFSSIFAVISPSLYGVTSNYGNYVQGNFIYPSSVKNLSSPSSNPVVNINSNISSAEVYIDGSHIGSTTVSKTILPGRHRIRVEKRHHETQEYYFDVSRGKNYTFFFYLENIQGTLVVHTNVPATVIVDNESVRSSSSSNVQSITLDEGHHNITVTSFGYNQWTKSVYISRREKTDITANLSPVPFSLTSLNVSRQVFNPRDILADSNLVFTIRATASAFTTFRIEDDEGHTVYKETMQLQDFETKIRWNGKPSEYGYDLSKICKDGNYTAIVEAENQVLKRSFIIDTSKSTVLQEITHDGSGFIQASAMNGGDTTIVFQIDAGMNIANPSLAYNIGGALYFSPWVEVFWYYEGLSGKNNIVEDFPIYSTINKGTWGFGTKIAGDTDLGDYTLCYGFSMRLAYGEYQLYSPGLDYGENFAFNLGLGLKVDNLYGGFSLNPIILMPSDSTGITSFALKTGLLFAYTDYDYSIGLSVRATFDEALMSGYYPSLQLYNFYPEAGIEFIKAFGNSGFALKIKGEYMYLNPHYVYNPHNIIVRIGLGLYI